MGRIFLATLTCCLQFLRQKPGMRPCILLPLLLLATSAMAADAPAHSGVAGSRTMPELSDLALFVCAAGGIWFVRSRLRTRFRRRRDED